MKTFKKSFIRNTSELEERLDPFFYKKEFLELEEKLLTINHVKFKKIIKIITKGSTPVMTTKGVPFLKVLNLNEFEIKTKKLDFISLATHEKMKRSQLDGDEILYTMAGTIGIAFNYNRKFEQANINQAIAKIKLFEPSLNKIIVYLLNSKLCQLQAKRLLTVSAQPNINFEQIKSIKIPFPPLETQNKIISIMDNAYKIKKENKQKAKELLDSVDTYLLKKLEIVVPKEKKVMSFEIDSSEIQERLDPFYHQKKFVEIEKQIENNFGTIKLKKLTLKITDGSHHSPKNTMELEKNFVTVKDLTHFGDLDLNNCYKISKEDFDILVKNGCQPLPNDILFSKDGTIGKVYTVTENNDFVVLSSLAILRPNQELIFPKYLEYILSSNIIILFIERLMSGSALRRIILDGIKNLIIPLPSLETQKEIANHIQGLREEAKQLQQEAKEVLASAKDEVEAIILK